MTETIVVALVTFSSGLVGALIGGLTAYKVAKFSAEKSIRQTIHTEKLKAYSELIESYQAFLSAITASMINRDWLTDTDERALYTRLQSAWSKAILICSEKTTLQLTLLLTSMNHYAADRKRPDDLSELFQKAVASMRSELSEDAN